MRRLAGFLPLVFALLVPAAAGAAVASDAADLLERVRSAANATAWQRVRLIAIEGRITASGLDGGYRALEDARTGRYDRRSRFSAYALREVHDGRTTWRQGHAGGVHRLDGDLAVRRSVTEAWLVRRAWLLPDAGGAYVGPVTRRTLDGVPVATLTAVPIGGQAVTLSFDPTTFDLVHSERVMPISVQQRRYADYRVDEGMRLPHAITTDDHDEDVETLTIDRYDLHVAPSSGQFAPLSAPRDWTLATPSVTVPFGLRTGKLTIEAKLNGQGPFLFIFDTGGHAIVTPALAAALQLETVGAGQSGGAGEGTLTEQFTRVATVEIGGLTLKDLHFFVLPFGYPTVERGAEAPLGGLFGVELLERLAVRFDYPARQVTFTPFGMRRFEPGATVTRVRFDDDIPLVDGRLDGHDGVFALDTGNSAAMLVQHRWAERVGIADRYKAGVETASFGAGGVSRNWVSRAERFEIGGAVLPRPITRYAEDQRGAFASRTEAGNIGTDVLAHFVIDFDYRKGLMSWKPVAGYVPPPFNRAGLRAMKDRPEDFIVVVAAKGSPADAAGVQAKDRIVAIDGRSASTLSGDDYAKTFAQPPGTVVNLTLMRDGRTIDTTVTLRELLP